MADVRKNFDFGKKKKVKFSTQKSIFKKKSRKKGKKGGGKKLYAYLQE